MKVDYEVYTDGSCKGPWGAWAYLVIKDGTILQESSGRERKTNSNRMEFQAVLEALRFLPAKASVRVYTDYRVLIQNIQEFPHWAENDWLKSDGRPVPNADQLQQLYHLIGNRNIIWQWVRAHAGNPYNERCDRLCLQARLNLDFTSELFGKIG